MNIIKEYLRENDCYKSATIMQIKGIMIHSVGCNVENPLNFIKSWNKRKVYKCVHAFISPYAIYETLPYNYRAWHCGNGIKGSFNDGYISVELTEPKTINYIKGSSFTDNDEKYTKRYIKDCYDVAVDYFAYLCEKFALEPLDKNIVLSHSEGHKMGYASNHGDVEHIWDYANLSMEEFRQDIKTKIIKNKVIKNIEMPDNKSNDTAQTNNRYYQVQI